MSAAWRENRGCPIRLVGSLTAGPGPDARRRGPRSWRLLLGLLLCVVASEAPAAAVTLAGTRQEILVNQNDGLPGRWTWCSPSCEQGAVVRPVLRAGEGGSRLAWRVPGDAAAEQSLANLEYVAETRRIDAGTVTVLTSREPWQGLRLIHQYSLADDGRSWSASIQLPAGVKLALIAGADFRPAPLPGLGAIYSGSDAVLVNGEGQLKLAAGAAMTIAAGDWAGLRSRFWSLLLQPGDTVELTTSVGAEGLPSLEIGHRETGSGALRLQLYGGPIEPASLRSVDPALTRMLYAGLWDWLRMLSFGLLYLLNAWQSVIGNPGLAIMLLSLTVKVLMWPLTFIAERWQADVNREQCLLKPELDAIRREFRGEEAHKRVLAVYAKHGVSQFYTVKSLAGVLIQIPVFIAAFDMLGENFLLSGAAFAGIRDLSLPDQAMALPVTLPFFGGYVNALPFLMTALTIAAARLQEDSTLSADLQHGQRLRLYGMAALFFVLLYTFPAGMVLYWTTNNLLHVIRVCVARLLRPAAG
jgi:YidC/Oxa1 family membrane protein insertase